MSTIDYKPRARFGLPDNWNVSEVACMLVPIPADPQYLAMAIGLLDRLKWSANYDRDPTGEGAAQVSRTWEQALNTQPIRFTDCEDTGMSLDLRAKPGEPWIMQASTDGGVTWHDALIQPHWTVASNTILTQPSGEQAARDLGAQILKFLESIAQQIADGVAAGKSKSQIVGEISDRLQPYGAGAVLTPFIEGAVQAGIDNPADAATSALDCTWIDPFEALWSGIEGAGSNLAQQLTSTIEGFNTALLNPVSNYTWKIAQWLGAASLRDVSQAYTPGNGFQFGTECGSDFMSDGQGYKLYGPFFWHFTENPEEHLIFFDVPTGESTAAVYGTCDNFPNTGFREFGLNQEGTISIPPGYTYLFGGVIFAPTGSGALRGARRVTGRPTTIYVDAGLEAPNAEDQDGLPEQTGPLTGATRMSFNCTAAGNQELGMKLWVITHVD